ncbi:MAG: hypothetical protein ACRCTY_03585 [Candidatus Adiutrix sp.]
MLEKLVLTNNPLLIADSINIAKRKVPMIGLQSVFEAALGLVQSGYKLLSAPLPPNLPLIRAPYRSLLLQKNGRRYDVSGIRSLTLALGRVLILGASNLNETQRQDAAYIDRDLFFRVLEECDLLAL